MVYPVIDPRLTHAPRVNDTNSGAPGGATAEPGGPSVGRRRFRLRGGAVWGVAAGLFLLLEALLAIGAPLLTGTNPLTGNLEHRLLAPGTAGYLLGTDQLGRDVLARMLYGARSSLVVGVVPWRGPARSAWSSAC